MIKEGLRNIANHFANVTSESHQRKLNEYRTYLDQEREGGTHETSAAYEVLDGESVIESNRLALGLTGVITLAPLGLYAFINGAENGDIVKGLIGVTLLALSVRLAKVPIRAIDNSNAVEEVIRENEDTDKNVALILN